jgi:RNA polymerase sigma factor (sigma-70 family)
VLPAETQQTVFDRFFHYAQALARQQYARVSSVTLRDWVQTALVGLLISISVHGDVVTPLQVQSAILSEFRSVIQSGIRNRPRATCTECGSRAVRACTHKKAARVRKAEPGDTFPYAFGKKENELVESDDTSAFPDGVRDSYSSDSTEREEELDRLKVLALRALEKVPASYRTVLFMRSVLWNDGNPASFSEIAEAIGVSRSTAERLHAKAVAFLKQIAAKPRPQFAATSQVPRLCSAYPTYHRDARLPWSQDSKFRLSRIPHFKYVTESPVERKENV